MVINPFPPKKHISMNRFHILVAGHSKSWTTKMFFKQRNECKRQNVIMENFNDLFHVTMSHKKIKYLIVYSWQGPVHVLLRGFAKKDMNCISNKLDHTTLFGNCWIFFRMVVLSLKLFNMSNYMCSILFYKRIF